MVIVGSVLRKVLNENPKLLHDLLEEILDVKILKINESKIKFGYNYYRPILFLEIETSVEESIYLAIQDTYEPTAAKITIVEMIEEIKIALPRKLIIFNFFKGNQYSENIIDKERYFDIDIFYVNTLNWKMENSLLNEFCIMVNNPSDMRILDFENIFLKDIAYKSILEVENDKNLKWNIEKSYRDRISIMSDEESVNNLYFNRALTLKVLYSYDLEELHDFFKVLEKEEFIRLITISFEKVKIFLELLRKGLNKWEIYDIFGKREFIMYLAEECIKRGIERIE